MDFDLDNLTVDYDTLVKVNKYYEKTNYKYFPMQIYIFLLHILPLVGKSSNAKINYFNFRTKTGSIRNLIDTYIHNIYLASAMIISFSNNLEVLIYALDNDIITLDNAFYYMCEHDKLEFVKYLLSSFENISIETINNGLYRASLINNIEIIKYLLHKYKYEKDILSNSLVKFASNTSRFNPKDEKNLEIVDLFIKQGADIHFNNDKALQINLRFSHKLENIKYLLDLNADPNNITQEIIDELKKEKKYDMLELLKEYGLKN